MKIIIILIIHLLVSYKCLIVNCLVNYIQWKSAKKSKFEKKSSSHENIVRHTQSRQAFSYVNSLLSIEKRYNKRVSERSRQPNVELMQGDLSWRCRFRRVLKSPAEYQNISNCFKIFSILHCTYSEEIN